MLLFCVENFHNEKKWLIEELVYVKQFGSFATGQSQFDFVRLRQ